MSRRGRFGPNAPSGTGGAFWDSDYMLKSVYDPDLDSIVDKAERAVKGTALPSGEQEGDMFLLTTDDHFYIAVE